MVRKQVHVKLLGVLVAPLLLIVAACGVVATTPDAGASATPAATASPGATGTSRFVNCAQLPEMKGAQQSVQILDTDFPDSGAAIATITSPTTAPMQIVRYAACMQVFVKGTVGPGVSVPIVSDTSSATAEVIDALNLVNRGWIQGTDFPFDGTRLQPCTAAQICFKSGPQDYLELEQVKDHGQGVLTFVLRVASPQPLVSCDPALFPVDYFAPSTAVVANATFPLPPATRMSTGYEDAVGTTTYFCTGGSIASIQAFMAKQLPASGWKALTFNGVQVWKFPSGVGPVCMRINPITDARKWSILTYAFCPDQ